jgi:hypothetical protein
MNFRPFRIALLGTIAIAPALCRIAPYNLGAECETTVGGYCGFAQAQSISCPGGCEPGTRRPDPGPGTISYVTYQGACGIDNGCYLLLDYQQGGTEICDPG